MNAIQLEFNINNESEADVKLSMMQRQIDDMHDSMGKVRRKLFAEVGELKKIIVALNASNEELKAKLKEITNEKTEWLYRQGDCLFDVREHKEECG